MNSSNFPKDDFLELVVCIQIVYVDKLYDAK